MDELFTHEEVLGLAYLAEGNMKLVENAIVYHMQLKRSAWWKFWEKPKWTIDRGQVINYIVDNRYTEKSDLNI